MSNDNDFSIRVRRATRLNWPRVAVAGILTFSLAACSVGPHYHRPDITPPPAWQAGDSTAAWPTAEFWQGFRSSQLDDLLRRAAQTNDDLAAAIARVRQADAQVRIAGAALLPAVNAGGQATRLRERTATTPGPETFNQFGLQVNASYELDFWGKNRALRTAAVAAAAASRYDRQTVELTIVTSVATAYFQALELRDRLNVAQNNLTSAQTILKGLKLEQSVGTATALDVAQQETTVATVNASIPPLEEALRQTLDALSILIGEMPSQANIAMGTLTDLGQPVVNPGLPSELLARRPDVAEAEAQLMAANANITVARAAFFPNIELTGSGGFASTALSTVLDPASQVFNLTAGVTQAIFQGGALTGQLALTKARYAELLADYHKAVISAFGNVEDALVALHQSEEQLQRQEFAVAKAQRAYDIAQAQMHAGTTNILTVLNTESALFTAQDQLVQVRFSHLQSLVSLYKALGGGWQQTKGA